MININSTTPLTGYDNLNFMNPQVDKYLLDGCMRCELGGTAACKVHNWEQELDILRGIVLDCGLNEELKWGVPCYTFNDANILLMSAFKEYCALSFFKGALLEDKHNILQKPGENTQAARLLRFTGVEEIIKLEPVIKEYIREAIAIEKAGLKVELKAKNELEYPEELLQKFDEDPVLKATFEDLTPGRQRGYILFFSAPKQSKTRLSRIEKCVPQIFLGKGLHDR